MRKLTLFMVSLAVVFWTNAASADRVYVPTSFSYASSDYTQLFITNLCSASVKVSASWIGAASSQVSGSSYTRTDYGFETPYSLTTTLAAGQTWAISTNADNIWGSTTTYRQGTITVESSASESPLDGAVGVAPFFVSTGSGKPSGFMVPPVRRTQEFTSYTSQQKRWRQ